MGNHHAREAGEEECELFDDVRPYQEESIPEVLAQHEAHQDELDSASIQNVSNANASSPSGPRRVNGQLVRPSTPRDDSPSTACQASSVFAPGGVILGKAAPGFGSPPGIVPS